MKAHVIKAVKLMHNSRNYMLARMVLHIAETKIKINFAFVSLSYVKRLIGEVQYYAVFYLHVGYIRVACISAVALLTAAFGEKGGLV